MIRRVAELDLGPGLEVVGFQSLRGWPNVSDEFATGSAACSTIVSSCRAR